MKASNKKYLEFLRHLHKKKEFYRAEETRKAEISSYVMTALTKMSLITGMEGGKSRWVGSIEPGMGYVYKIKHLIKRSRPEVENSPKVKKRFTEPAILAKPIEAREAFFREKDAIQFLKSKGYRVIKVTEEEM